VKVHDARDGFNDLKPDFLTGTSFPWFWVAAIIIIILILLNRRPKSIKETIRTRKSLAEFLSELKTISSKIDAEKGTPKELTAEASLVVRRYLFDRTGISIVESTPQEAEGLLTATNRFSGTQAREISKLLSQLENISFSEIRSEVEVIQGRARQLVGQCEALLQKIEPKLVEAVI